MGSHAWQGCLVSPCRGKTIRYGVVGPVLLPSSPWERASSLTSDDYISHVDQHSKAQLIIRLKKALSAKKRILFFHQLSHSEDVHFARKTIIISVFFCWSFTHEKLGRKWSLLLILPVSRGRKNFLYIVHIFCVFSSEWGKKNRFKSNFLTFFPYRAQQQFPSFSQPFPPIFCHLGKSFWFSHSIPSLFAHLFNVKMTVTSCTYTG